MIQKNEIVPTLISFLVEKKLRFVFRDDRSDGGLNGLGASDEMSGLDGMASASHNRGLDEKTEIILAATFLVLIILAFIR